MENINHPSKRLHPLVATAAVAVIVVSLTGVAAITGVLPNSYSSGSPTRDAYASGSTSHNAISPLAQLTPDDKLVNDVEIAPAPRSDSYTPPLQQRAPVALAPKPTPRVIEPDTVRYNEPMQQYREPVRSEPVRVAAVCNNCGRVETVSAIQHDQPTSGVGVAAGAVLGGLLGNQVGGGNGRTLATVAGAVGGSLAGNEVERRTRGGATSYQVRVRMEDGSVRSFPYSAAPSWNAGDRVRVVNGRLTSRG